MKSKELLIILGFLLVVIILIYNPFRYKITGTNEGYIYKTDRYTGKTWIVTPRGEIEVKQYQRTSPTPEPSSFSIGYLQLVTLNIPKQFLMEIVVKNNSETTARNINYKIRYYNKQGGDVVDTEYKTGANNINGGDTVTETFYIKDYPYVDAQIVSAEQ